MEETLWVENSAMFIANRRLEDTLGGEGDTANRVIVSHPAVGTYTPGTDINDKDLSSSKEALTVNTWKYASVYVDDTEMKQNLLNAGENAAHSMMEQINNVIEQAVLSEVTNAGKTLDASAVGGSAGSYIQLNTDNISQIFTAANTKLNVRDVKMPGRIAVIGGHTLEWLQLTAAGRQTNLGDNALANGYMGKLFQWDIVYNNNLPYSATLNLTVQPTDGDIVTIADVTFTFKTTLGATKGNVLINGSAAAAVTNLVRAINGTGTPATDYVEIDTEDRFTLTEKRGITATDNTTNIALAGFGDITVLSTFTSGSNAWTAQRQESLFLQKGAIDLVVQIPPKIEIVRPEKRFGERVKALGGYGKKTYADGARKMVRVKIDASTWV